MRKLLKNEDIRGLVIATGVASLGTGIYLYYIKNFVNPKVQDYNEAYFQALEIRMKEDRIAHVERVKEEREYILKKVAQRYEVASSLESIVGKELPVANAISETLTKNPLFGKWRPVGVNESELPWITYNPYNAPLFFDPKEGKGVLQEIAISTD